MSFQSSPLVLFVAVCFVGISFGDPHNDMFCPHRDLSHLGFLLSCEQISNHPNLPPIVRSSPSDPPILCDVANRTAYCDNKNLTEVPQYLPLNINFLSLRNNAFTHIQKGSFSRYQQLTGIDLSMNQITQLYSNSFQGLSRLRCLNLRHNKLAYVKSNFPFGVFQPFNQTLRLLVMSFNNPHPTQNHLHYPVNELSRLTSLTSLYMDGLKSSVFGPGFRNMTSLTVLSLSGYTYGYCHLDGLHSDAFINVAQIKCLYLIGCSLIGKNIHEDTFRPLKRLVGLDLGRNQDIGLLHIARILKCLQNTTSLGYLGLHLVIPRYSFGIVLKKQYLEYLPPSVEYIDARENSLEAVTPELINSLPKALTTLELSGNSFVFGHYISYLSTLENLHTLKLNGLTLNVSYNIPLYYPYHPSEVSHSKPSSVVIEETKQSYVYDHYGNDMFIFKLPPNLKTLEINNGRLQYYITELHFDPNNALERLSIKYNNFPSLIGPVTGLLNLKCLDISWSFVQFIENDFFKHFPSLEMLILDHNFLWNFFKSDISNDVFSSLTNLKHIDLAFNDIRYLWKDIFKGLNNLEVIRFDRNMITKFNCDISHMANLTFLNLSNTHLPRLYESTRVVIDGLIAKNKDIKVDLSWAPISCDCENLEFLEWMVKSPAFDKSFNNYRCDFNRGLQFTIIKDGYRSILQTLRRKCIPSTKLYILVVVLVVIGVLIIAGLICYRFRWNLKYLYHVAYIHYKGDGKHRSKEFEFDAFICYANEDQNFVFSILEEELKQRGLNVLVHDRDFVTGEYISTNIVGAVCRSRKTLVVLSPHMIKSSWCNYEIQMANMESIHTGRKVLIFLLKGTITKSQLNLDMYYNIKSNTYLELPQSELADAEQMRALWDKLASDIQH